MTDDPMTSRSRDTPPSRPRQAINCTPGGDGGGGQGGLVTVWTGQT